MISSDRSQPQESRKTDEQRERRREMMAQQAEMRQTAEVTRGIGNPVKVFQRAHASSFIPLSKPELRVARDSSDNVGHANQLSLPGTIMDARSPCGSIAGSPSSLGSWEAVDLPEGAETPSDIQPQTWDEHGYSQDMREVGEVAAALQASLEGVTFSVRFLRPDNAGGEAAGRAITLDLDALALLGDIEAIVEVEMFGAAGRERAHLTFGGEYVPSDVPIYHLGIGDGDTVIVEAVGPLDHTDFEKDPVLRWAFSDEV